MIEGTTAVLFFVMTGALLGAGAAVIARKYGVPLVHRDRRVAVLALVGACISAWASRDLAPAPVTSIALACCTICAISDWQRGYIFDVVTIPSAIAIAVARACGGSFATATCGAASAAGILYLLHLMTRGRGMGLGDVKLAAVIGAAFGVEGALVALTVAFVTGACKGILAVLRGRVRHGDIMPFGPFLAAGTMAVALVGGRL